MEGPDQTIQSLLPRPRQVELLGGTPIHDVCLRPDCRHDDDRLHRALDRFLHAIGRSTGCRRDAPAGTTIPLVVDCDASAGPPGDGYRLKIARSEIVLTGGTTAGCFHGLQTLMQLVAAASEGLPCCRIEDRPDFRTRGLLHDVTRGKVPTLDTLKHIVDRLAAWKGNQLQLNIEHALAFSFDPEICAASEGLTPDEVRELDAYCRDRFIELLPAIATLGHMGRILSMPAYKHLAEIEADRSWGEMTWPQRMRGLTLDCASPESLELLERMCGDIMDAFSAPHVNCCGDEPFDLGMGKNAGRWGDNARGQVYVDHLRKVHDICAARGRQVMFWGDVLKSYRNLLPSLPDEITLLHWGYDDSAEYDLTAAFVSSGHDTYVCPGTSGWKRILNAMDLAERNISTFADMGRQAGASGLLNTDWGDHGHFNMLASSWHGIALGACKGWRCDHPCGLEFDRILARNQWGMDDGACFSMLRQASALAAQYETWRLFWQPLGETGDELRSIPQEDIASMCAAAAKAKRFFSDHSSLESATQDDFVELHLACRFLDCFADKVEFAHAASRGNHGGSEGESIWHCFDDLIGMTRDFAACWLRRNKPSGLDDIRRALHAVREDLLTRATA